MTFVFMSPEDADRHRQQHAVSAHELNRLLHELPIDQLKTLEMLIDWLAMAEEPGRIASHMSGRITAVLEARFNICAACGKNHDKDLENLASDKPVEVPPHVQARRAVDAQSEVTFLEKGSTEPLSAQELQLMQMFGIDDLREEDSGALLGFICLNSEMHYQSIQDRMLQPPGVEGCSGCQQKARWG